MLWRVMHIVQPNYYVDLPSQQEEEQVKNDCQEEERDVWHSATRVWQLIE